MSQRRAATWTRSSATSTACCARRAWTAARSASTTTRCARLSSTPRTYASCAAAASSSSGPIRTWARWVCSSAHAALAFADPVNPVTVQYLVAFFGADTFYTKHGRYPGQAPDAQLDEDNAALLREAMQYAADVHLELSEDDVEKLADACREMYVARLTQGARRPNRPFVHRRIPCRDCGAGDDQGAHGAVHPTRQYLCL